MKVLLINPSYIDSPPLDAYFSITGFTIPHLGLGYIASYLEQHGFFVDLIECMGQGVSQRNLYDLIDNNDYALVGISVYDGNKLNAIRLVQYIKRNKPSSFVCFGGYTATLAYENILNTVKKLDCCILGEGELTMLELANALKENKNINEVAGIAYRSNDIIVVTDKRNLITDLDMLPFPKRSFYSARGEVTLVSSRGCMNNCSYCAINSYYKFSCGEKFRCRSAENIFDEILHIIKMRPQTSLIGFYDDNFLSKTVANVRRLSKFIELMKLNKVPKISFEITACANDICENIGILSELKSIGLTRVFVGIESFVERQLRYYRKKATVNDNINALNLLYELGLEASIGFVPFDPYVTIEEIASNFTYLKDPNIHLLPGDYTSPYSASTPLIAVAGTDFRKELEHSHLFKNNELGYSFIDPQVELFYRIRNEWLQKNSFIRDNLFYILVAKQTNAEMYTFLKEKRDKYIKHDINFILLLCDWIYEKKYIENDFDSLLMLWLEEIDDVCVAFQQAKNTFSGVMNDEYNAI